MVCPRELRPAAGAVLCHRSWQLGPLAETLHANSGVKVSPSLNSTCNPCPTQREGQTLPLGDSGWIWECSGTRPDQPSQSVSQAKLTCCGEV